MSLPTGQNPFLEEDEEDALPPAQTFRLKLPSNPFLEDDDEDDAPAVASQPTPEPVVLPTPVPPTPKRSGPVVKPEFAGKPGYDSLGRRKTRRAGSKKPTEKDAIVLAHLAKFRVAYEEDLAELALAAPSFEEGAPKTNSPRTLQNRLYRLKKLGYVETTRDKRGRRVWGSTADAVSVAQSWGILTREGEEHPESWKKIGYSYSDHFLMIARVAAQFVSPTGFFRETLGLEPVAPSSLLAEHELRQAWKVGTEELLKLKQQQKSTDYPSFRQAALKRSMTAVSEGRLSWSSMLTAEPMLWTIGSYGESGSDRNLQAHLPDLIVNREEQRTGSMSESILVEVELNAKPWKEYEALLRGFAQELSTCAVIGHVVYFVPGKKDGTPGPVERLLRDVDAAGGLGLFASGRFHCVPLFERDGSPIKQRRLIGE